MREARKNKAEYVNAIGPSARALLKDFPSVFDFSGLRILTKSGLMTSLLEIIMRSKAIARKFNQGE